MKPNIIKVIYNPVIKKATRQALLGRNRDRNIPENGRFTHADVDNIITQTWHIYNQLTPNIPHEPTLGSRMNMHLACITFACLQSFLKQGVERTYTIELIGDIAWKIYEKWGKLPFLLAHMKTRNPVERMRFSVNLFLRFPFTPPAYVFERLPAKDGISLDMRRCPVAEYFQTQHATDLCLGTWCNLDYGLAEMWGGWLERSKTLVAGCDHCDFRFKVGVMPKANPK